MISVEASVRGEPGINLTGGGKGVDLLTAACRCSKAESRLAVSFKESLPATMASLIESRRSESLRNESTLRVLRSTVLLGILFFFEVSLIAESPGKGLTGAALSLGFCKWPESWAATAICRIEKTIIVSIYFKVMQQK